MLKNYFLIAFRNLSRGKGFAAINIGGLAIGMAAFLLISLFVRNELAYDLHHNRPEDLYRVLLDAQVSGNDILTANTPTPLAETMVNEVPGVVAATRIDGFPRLLVAFEDQQFYEDGFFLVDSTAFDLFSYEYLEGDPNDILTRPNTVSISEETARRYFGSGPVEEVIGKTITVDARHEYEIVGVFRASGGKSHFQPDLLGSMITSDRATDGMWLNNTLYTYVRLAPATDPEDIEARLPGIIDKYVAPEIERLMGGSFEEALSSGMRYNFVLEPVTDIYLRSRATDQIGPTGDIKYVIVFSAIALFVLLIGCINFINLSTARSTARAREVGLRKALGSGRSQLIQQFMGESTIVVLIAMVLALGLATAALPWFNKLADSELEFGPLLFAALGIVAVVTGILAGLYPALVLSGFEPVTVLRGSFSRSSSGTLLRSSLVVFQFGISIVLMVGTGVVSKQLRFMHERDLGFKKEQVVVLPVETSKLGENFDAFREEILANTDIVDAAAANMLPGPYHTHQHTAFRRADGGPDDIFIAALGEGTPEYAQTLGLSIVAGRFFSRDLETDVDGFLINETASAKLGWSPVEAVGKRLVQAGGNDDESDRVGEIVGVFADAHFSSLHETIKPRIIGQWRRYRYLPVRIQPENTAAVLDFLEVKWSAFEPGYPFRYFFLDQDFARFYDQEERLVTILGYFTAFAILISCLGLFGLSSFVTVQRTKEIGVRKVLGASIGSVVLLLSREFTRLVLVAAVFAFPIAYLAMKAWLAGFAYATEIGWAVFLLAGVTTLAIAWTTVGWQSARAAVSDPVTALRYE